MKQRTTIFATAVVAVIAASTIYIMHRNSSIKIEGRIVGSLSDEIYLERHNGIKQSLIDTLELESRGEFSFKITDADDSPTLYEIRCGDERIPLLAQRGDRINIESIGNISLNYKVKGSEESELLRSFYQPYIADATELKKLASTYAIKQRNHEDTDEVAIAYNDLYKKIKKEQIEFIISNKSNIAAIYAVMQLLPGDQFLINDQSDLIYQRTIAEAVKDNYPDSPYLNFLNLVIESKEAQIELMSKVNLANYPDIELADRFGKKVKLSSFDGDVILLDFWNSQVSESNQNNAELKEVYNRYKDQGFEVYQVGIASSKAAWINAIQSQKLPWVSVSDLRGEQSPALRLYNVKSLPYNILISKSGEIVGSNLFSTKLDRAIAREIKK